MKAFVTGSTGLLGSNLVRLLLAQGHEVKALGDGPNARTGGEPIPVFAVGGESVAGRVQGPARTLDGRPGGGFLKLLHHAVTEQVLRRETVRGGQQRQFRRDGIGGATIGHGQREGFADFVFEGAAPAIKPGAALLPDLLQGVDAPGDWG